MRSKLSDLIADHGRYWRGFAYVYPVISRRSQGLSIGINLNVEGACNFDCIYCQVDLSQTPRGARVDLELLRHELDEMLQLVDTGKIWRDPKFYHTPHDWRRLSNIAFSGDGEPTAHRLFGESTRLAVELRDRHGHRDVPIVVITNATRLDQPAVVKPLRYLDKHRGQVWAKLDAGTEDDFQRVDRPRGGITLAQVVDQIAAAGRERALVIQSMFLAEHGRPPGRGMIDAYVERLAELVERGCKVERVDLYTVARRTRVAGVSPVEPAVLHQIAERVTARLPQLNVIAYAESVGGE